MKPKFADASSGSEVAGNEDLLTEILLRIPPKSLLRFKSVSKPWLHLISSSQFRRHSSRRLSKDVSGLFYQSGSYINTRDLKFIPLDETAEARSRRNSPLGLEVEWELNVIDHCNGLLLCSSSNEYRRRFSRQEEYYVFNPTTKEYTTVSVDQALMVGETLINLTVHPVKLAFDPRKSLHYKLLFIRSDSNHLSYLQIYSSNTGTMRQMDEPFTRHFSDVWVYWNGAVHWFDWDGGMYFNIDEERFGKLPMIPEKEGGVGEKRLAYFGESNDHLHMILIYTMHTNQFDVLEMDREYSGWSVRFRVDLFWIFGSNPPDNFSVMGVFRNDGKSFLLLGTPGMVHRLNLEDDSAAVIYRTRTHRQFHWKDSIPFIESLYRP